MVALTSQQELTNIVRNWNPHDKAKVNQLIDLNLRGVYNCLDVVLPGLLARGDNGSGGIGIVSEFWLIAQAATFALSLWVAFGVALAIMDTEGAK